MMVGNMNKTKTVHVVSVSGGKDSTVTLAIAIQRVGLEGVRAIYCDTGNENQIVYDYLNYLEERFGLRIERLKADFSSRVLAKRKFIANDQRTGRRNGKKIRWSNKAKRRALAVLYPSGNPFLDLCMWKGRFPSRKASFCTEQLKQLMAVQYQSELICQGLNVISWQGVRRDESRNRANAKKIERMGNGFYCFRPLVEWSAEQVFEYHKTNTIKPNPLYSLGMSRVGCMPCINVNKGELRQIAKRFPEEIIRVEEWERITSLCSKLGFTTFICKESHFKNKMDIFAELNINSAVQWSKTTRGGRQFDLLAELPIRECSSAYGLCE